jgi:hypothetical protein
MGEGAVLMDWFNRLGSYYMFLSSAPALAMDLALNGPNADRLGYALANSVNATSAEFDPYPSEGAAGELY